MVSVLNDFHSQIRLLISHLMSSQISINLIQLISESITQIHPTRVILICQRTDRSIHLKAELLKKAKVKSLPVAPPSMLPHAFAPFIFVTWNEICQNICEWWNIQIVPLSNWINLKNKNKNGIIANDKRLCEKLFVLRVQQIEEFIGINHWSLKATRLRRDVCFSPLFKEEVSS